MLKTKINIKPAYDHMIDGSGLEDYGRCCAMLELEVIGLEGALVFNCFTNWWSEETIKEMPKICLNHKGESKTLTSNILHIHSKEELPDSNYTEIGNYDYCTYTQAQCYLYCIGTDIEQKLARLIVNEGSAVVLEEMANIYNKVFKTKETLDIKGA